MISRAPYSFSTTSVALLAFFSIQLLALLCLSPVAHGQIFNGGNVIPIPPAGGNFNPITDAPLTYIIPDTPVTPTSSSSSTPSSSSQTQSTNATATPPPPPPAPTTPPPPIPVQPYMTMGPNTYQAPVTGPLPLPTTPALFPQNISTCSTCYGMFSTLSRCNVIANTNTFPVTANTTYESLLPFLKCICTYKALEVYPYCIDCFQKTQQLNQLNVLQAYHLENYVDAFHQLCGVTYNGNKVAINAASALVPSASRIGPVLVVTIFSAWMGLGITQLAF
ncbi:hypothetical protein EMPS_01999 [Entomortierella parvispora]|uniref:Uncharacterized protein n=1 Tax=Entomortierella parvispora TaxID=205924 RepID=A0A9P3H3X0_9FUNG|nr:hypothetical protein EMPS_01999 [Entomortierella parvispora]